MSEPFVIEQKQADGSYKQLIPLGYINRNELDNSYFISSSVINQRGISTTSTIGYFIDRWKLVSGTVTLTPNGLILNGTMAQILPSAIGNSYSANVGMFSGTANITYDDIDATCTITSAGGIIRWAKLEIGEVITPFVPKKYSEELYECQRYYFPFSGNIGVFGGIGASQNTAFIKMVTPAPMRTVPTISSSVFSIRTSSGTNPQGSNPIPISVDGLQVSITVTLNNPATSQTPITGFPTANGWLSADL